MARAIVLLEREDGGEFARWTVAAAIVLAAHLGLVATYFLFFPQSPAGMPQAPAIIIDMSPLPAAPVSSMDVDPGPKMVEAQPQPMPQPIVEPKPPEPIIELPPSTPVEPLVALPEPPKEPPPPEVRQEPTPKPQEVTRAEPKKAAPRTTAPPRSERTAETPSAPRTGASSAAAVAAWQDQVVAQLQRAKRYPSGSDSRREQGVVTLSFSLGRNGNVLSRSITRGSGYSELDQEAMAMVMRAQPFPAFPAGMNQPRVNLTVPIRFSLR